MGQVEKRLEVFNDAHAVMRLRWSAQQKHTNQVHALVEKAQQDVILLKNDSIDHNERLGMLPQLENQLATFENKMDEIVDKKGDEEGASSTEYRVLNQTVDGLRKQLNKAEQLITNTKAELLL